MIQPCLICEMGVAYPPGNPCCADCTQCLNNVSPQVRKLISRLAEKVRLLEEKIHEGAKSQSECPSQRSPEDVAPGAQPEGASPCSPGGIL